MAEDRRLRLGAFMRPVGIHTAWWRYPGAIPTPISISKHLNRFAQKLERGNSTRSSWPTIGGAEHANGGA